MIIISEVVIHEKEGHFEFEVSVKKGPLMTHGFGDVLTTKMIVMLMIDGIDRITAAVL